MPVLRSPAGASFTGTQTSRTSTGTQTWAWRCLTLTRRSAAGGSLTWRRCVKGAAAATLASERFTAAHFTARPFCPQAAIFSHMLAEAGAPIAGTPVPEADPAAFEAWLVEGYEEVAGAGAVDLERLRRMVGLRRTFYDAFASRALAEGVPGDIAPSMVPFLEYTLRWTRGGAVALPAAAAPPLSGPV